MNLVSALHKNAICYPDRPALIDPAYPEGDNTFTYKDLYALTTEYMAILRSRNLSKACVVIICMENSVEYVATLYACWALGLIVAPLHSQSKAREIRHVHNITGAPLVIRKVTPSSSIELDIIETIGIASESSLEEGHKPKPLFAEELGMNILANDIALILFTSGTTGNPKGVTLSHKNLLSNSASIVSYLKLTEQDRTYSILPFTYSYGNSVLQSHILAGACVQLGASMVYPQKVAEALVDDQITGFYGVPSTYQILMDKTGFSQSSPKLRYITQAGGAMSITMTKRLLKLLADTDIFIMYGQTEATARLTYLPPKNLLNKTGSVGIPIPGVDISIQSPEGLSLAPNQEGEVCARGDNIMSGYWQNETATNESLVNGWLHTGDIGYVDEDGFLFLKGRKRQMIKSGANRIHPGEIEEVISEVPIVSEVAVTGEADPLLGERICAYIVLKTGGSILKTDGNEAKRSILKHCRENLPPHKQPKKLVWLTEFPRTSSGKIQKHLLQKTESTS